jgi:2'-5' RNA ligase
VSSERPPASDERARLFVALELPDGVREALVRWRDRVVREISGLRAVRDDALHVTLCFIGSRPADEIRDIGGALGVLAAERPAPLALHDARWLPPGRPRVLAIGLSDPQTALANAQAAISRELQAGGFYVPEARPFFAHVTVARVGKGVRVRTRELPQPPQLRFDGSTVTLFHSRLSRSGARYEALRTVELASMPPAADPTSVVRRFHAEQARAYADGELEGIRETLHEDVVWHVPGRSAISGDHRGVEAVLAYLDRRRAMTDSTFRVEVHGVALVTGLVVQLAGGRARRDGREHVWETVGLFRVCGGRIAECWLLPLDQQAFDEIWS